MILLISLLLSICINAEQVFVACEGNYYDGNQGTLWSILDGEVYEYGNNPIGSVAQSLYVHENMLFVIVNGSGNIQVFNITETSLVPIYTIDTQNSSPREMAVYNNYLYFTNWYSMDIKKLNLETWVIDEEIAMPGLPEDIILHNDMLYVSITMNSDWSDGDKVVSINPNNNTINQIYSVGFGPGKLAIYNNEIYVSRTFYDESWNAFYGTSKIRLDGSVLSENYGNGAVCGGGIYKYQDSIYRIYDGGIAQLDENLQILPQTKIGNYDSNEVYAAEVINDNVYFSLTDFIGQDDVAVVDVNGNEIARYTVGSIPGDFAVWSSCLNNGDANIDGNLDILDVVLVVNIILNNEEYNCNADPNYDNIINVIDIVFILQEIN